jgi:hypothetical protein
MNEDSTNLFRLPDGDLATDSVAVARHWAGLYGELIPFEEQVLGRAEELMVGRSDSLREAVHQSNLQPLAELIAEFRERSKFWKTRVQQLEGGLQ